MVVVERVAGPHVLRRYRLLKADSTLEDLTRGGSGGGDGGGGEGDGLGGFLLGRLMKG